MILGTHNSLTYLKPIKKWWNLFYKCQDKTLKEQLDMGIQMIDIKVRFTSDSLVAITNGKWTSELQWEPKRLVEWVINAIRTHQLEDNRPFYIKLTLDTDNIYFGQEIDFIMLGHIFKEYIGNNQDKIILFGGHRTFDDEKVIVTIPDSFVAYPVNCFSTQSKWYDKYFPKLFAKRNNEKNMKLWENENCIVAFDFL